MYLSQDLGFGCLGKLDGTRETVQVWVQPMPAGWDAAATCAVPHDKPFYEALLLGPADAGAADVLAAAPDAAWAQGQAQGTWRRDLSPCGGVVNFEVTLAVP